MPRANRHYIPSYVWHITHRCHKKEFLLEFARDRQSKGKDEKAEHSHTFRIAIPLRSIATA